MRSVHGLLVHSRIPVRVVEYHLKAQRVTFKKHEIHHKRWRNIVQLQYLTNRATKSSIIKCLTVNSSNLPETIFRNKNFKTKFNNKMLIWFLRYQQQLGWCLDLQLEYSEERQKCPYGSGNRLPCHGDLRSLTIHPSACMCASGTTCTPAKNKTSNVTAKGGKLQQPL